MPRTPDKHITMSARTGVRMAVLACVLIGVMAGPAAAVTQLKRQAEAPAIVLKDLGGTEVSTAKLRQSTLVLIFGEAYHDKTRQACTLVDTALRDPRLQGQRIVPLLIVTQTPTAENLRLGAGEKLPATILLDPARQAFGTYEVAVMPSIVVVDGEGRVAHAMAGLSGRFGDIVTDSLLYATGKLSLEHLELTLNPQPTTTPASENQVRAERIAMLARQLGRRGLDQMAIEKYREALALASDQPAAHVELGMLLLKGKQLAEAEAQFREVLSKQAGDAQAAMGLATVQITRGGAELTEAERTVRDVLARNPSNPRAHYLLGLIGEQRGKLEDAAASFKKSAQLQLERGEQE